MEPKKTYKTYHFQNGIALKTARRGIMTNEGHPPVEIGSPPEFKGTPDVWCPEELLIGAVNTCLMLTFLSYAQHRSLEISAYESSAEGTVENVDGKYRVTRIAVHPRVSLNRESDIPLALELFKGAKDGCFISNSVTATVDLSPQFRAKNGGSPN
ncbi:MAG: OsmC family protein [Terriglobia bacterium]